MDARPEIFALPPAALSTQLGSPARAGAVYALLREGRDPFHPGALGPRARARLEAACRPSALTVAEVTTAADGTVKLLVRLEDGLAVETVLIPEPRRTTVCVSSQVGCGRGCIFCLTATMRLARNLRPAEIVGQVAAAIREARGRGLAPLRNVVLMGMGEPLDNIEAVAAALPTITASGRGLAVGPAHVTVSTVGPSPRAIEAARALPGRLAWSLHAARDDVRRHLVPTARHDVRALAAAMGAVVAARRELLFVELTLIDRVNDADEDAAAVVELFAGFPAPVRFNLLPMNPAGRADLHPSPPEAVQRFAAHLAGNGFRTLVRRARGADQGAACGQLAVALAQINRTRPGPPPGAAG